MNPVKDRTEHIVIIDDTPANLAVMVEYLSEIGFHTMVARTGEAGLQIARREHPDLILLDVMLPGIDGFEVCRQLKADEQTQDIPVIFMTVVTDVEGKVTGFQAGGVDYITKPFQLEEVLARVTTHLTLHRLQQDLRELNRTLEDKVEARTAELTKVNRAYKALSECNQALLRATGEDELLHDICRIIQQECGYRLAWIGLAEQDDAHTVRPVAQAGYEEGDLETVTISWGENVWGQGPAGTAIRTGEPVVNCDVLTNPAYAPWREEALKRGYASSAAIPLATGDRVLGVLNVYAAEPDAFTPDEVALLTEIAHDLAYGLDALRMQAAHRQLETALAESEELHRVTMGNIVDPVFITDDDGNFTFICSNVGHVLRYTVTDLHTMSNITGLVGDMPFRLEDLHAQGTLQNLERVVTDRDGHAHTFLITVKQVSIKGGTILWLLHDVTERKQAEEALRESEQRYREIFENMLEAITIVNVTEDNRFQLLDSNPAMEKMTGISRSVLIGRFMDEVSGEHMRIALEHYRECLARGTPISDEQEYCLYGRCWTAYDTQIPVRDAAGRIYRLISISLDITERKRAEEELQQHREHLEELVAERTEALQQEIVERKRVERALQEAKNEADAASQAKSVFLANVSHELRTPLNAILGFAQLLRREAELTPARQEKLDAILRSGEHLLQLINDVLDLSKIEAGRMTLHLTPVDLWELLTTLEEMLRERVAEKGMQFNVVRPPEPLRYIKADETKLRQVLINLLGNAIKFTEQGSVTLEVTKVTKVTEVEEFPFWEGASPSERMGVGSQSSQPVSGTGPASGQASILQFSISDTGIGIAPEELNKIFQSFTQSEHVGQRYEGTGLGLAISQAFVHLMGGELQVTSTAGKGSCFAFVLPVELVETFAIPTAPAPRRVTGLAPDQPVYRTLVVDDDQDNRMFLAELLRSVGFAVQEAANGVEAFAQYVYFHPHLIWMDIQLPIMNGYDTTELIRELEGRPVSVYPRTIIVALTGHVFEEERANILAAGCDDMLRKPITEADIFETLHRYLGVEYVYAEGDRKIEEEQSAQRLTPEALATLPADLLEVLEQAVIRGNRHDIERILDTLRPQYAPVADMVARLVKEFKYKEIWRMIQRINQT